MKISQSVAYLLAAIVVTIIMFGCSQEQQPEPFRVQLKAFELSFLPDGAKPVNSYLSEMRRVTFYYDASEPFRPGVIGAETNRLDYIVDKDDVSALICGKEVDPETGKYNPRLYRVLVSEPYMSSPDTNGVPVLDWVVVRSWASNGG